MQCNVGATKFQILVKETASFFTTRQTLMEECNAIGVCLGASPPPHLQTPLFIKSCCRITQSLLLSGIAGPFCSGHFNPFKSSFLLSIWTVTITHPVVETLMVFQCLKGLLRQLWVGTMIIKQYYILK